MKSTRLLMACMVIISCLSACTNADKDKNSDGLTKEDEKMDKGDDAEFLRDAATINLEEIRISELAASMATMQDTKDMAVMMVNDHKAAYAAVSTLAGSMNIAIPTSPADDADSKYDKLTKKEGADFDKDYADMMVSGHKDAIDRFEKAAKDCDDAAVVALANNTLPKLREHLQHAEHCQGMAKDAK